MDSIRDSFRQQGLVRPTRGRLLGGVCAGLGRRFNMSANVARLLFVVILCVLPGSQFLIYPVLWVLMPDERATYRVPPTGTPYPPAG
jgi:phage shock protein PspC (stress-responsive transcriptional regulator)